MSDRPVSQQMQNDPYGHYGWDLLWGGGMFGAGMYGGAMSGRGMGVIASPLSATADFGTAAVQEAERGKTDRDDGHPHLRSIDEVTGYHVHATDGDIGHVQGFLVDNANWGVRYLVVDTSNWRAGQHVLISPYAVKGTDWSERHIQLDLTRDKIKSSPSWNPSRLVTGEFGRRLHNLDDWPGYGW